MEIQHIHVLVKEEELNKVDIRGISKRSYPRRTKVII